MIASLVGKDSRHVSRDRLIFYSRLLYQVKMGYVDLQNQRAHQTIEYYPEEHAYDHDLSIQSIGRNYEKMKLRDIFPMDLYLNLPPDISDELIKGLLIGIDDRSKLEEYAAAEKERLEAIKKEEAGQQFNQLHNNGEG